MIDTDDTILNLNQSLKYNSEINKLMVYAATIVPYVDLCNTSTNPKQNVIGLKPIKGFLTYYNNLEFKQGKEIYHTYNTESGSLVVMINSGYIINKNPLDNLSVNLNTPKEFNKRQMELCRRTKCLDMNYFNSNAIFPTERSEMLNSAKENKRLINFIKVQYLTENGNEEKYEKIGKAIKGFLDWTHEIYTWLRYHSVVYTPAEGYKLLGVESSYESDYYRQKCKKEERTWNYNDSIEKRNIWANYKMTENVHKLDVNYKLIAIRHTNFALKRIVKSTYDEINNLREKIVNKS